MSIIYLLIRNIIYFLDIDLFIFKIKFLNYIVYLVTRFISVNNVGPGSFENFS